MKDEYKITHTTVEYFVSPKLIFMCVKLFNLNALLTIKKYS